jgi:putative secretion ATPase (PEP-CTERM system associated)
MYEKYYNYTSVPFQLTPDVKYFFGSKGHSRAIAHLIYGLSQGEGFIVITGEVGAGKTTLVERLWSQLDRDTYTTARIATTQVSGEDLFRLAMAGFGLEDEAPGRANLLRKFDQLLQEHQRAGRRCLLVVDEAQNLSVAALEELRMLSNVTGNGGGALQTILLGQPQFRKILGSPDLDQLRQRVLASYHLGPLSEEETRSYIEHRLRLGGWDGRNPQWEDGTFAAIYRHSDGIPRRINRLCSRALMHGALDETQMITRAMIEATAEELQEDLRGSGPEGPDTTMPERGNLPAITTATGNIELSADERRLLSNLMYRVEALEERVGRREQLFQRLAAIFAGDAAK